jgi:hypothetical protein
MQEKMDAREEDVRSNQANTDTTLQVMQEKELLAKLEADRKANMKA